MKNIYRVSLWEKKECKQHLETTLSGIMGEDLEDLQVFLIIINGNIFVVNSL